MTDPNLSSNTIELATELTIAWLNNPNNRAGAEDVPAFLQKMHSTLTELSTPEVQSAEAVSEGGAEPAVSVRKSLASKDFIISLIDGKPYKSLKRHLSGHGLTPEQYRERYKLKPDYPMVAENYAKQRRDLALKIGLGSKGRAARSAKRVAASKPGRTKPTA
ncbi:transcriptional regulator (plasmid) [Sphingomonas changnyeongensis]|uniref:Transcriptional regulator n=1 Tax=Sphingomonas changnyeongensis TaxID=2698679 RepID=A0A7Z2NY84_9SPHN|nr:MucR family transcriptional regulator [Sphingomonas changnyeongensis]QHL92016.1 transcriptional regulator [Sphingomonas changnyeongensis]